MPGVLPYTSRGNFRHVFWALILSNVLSLSLFFARAADAGNSRYWFLLWNLLLGWLPLLFAWWLSVKLKRAPWATPVNIVLTALWLGFLPNSFYLISDLIHLHVTGEVSLLYDIAMFFSFIFNGFVVGYMSVFLVHRELLKRTRRRWAHGLVGVVFLLSGFAIYMGRFLRWNTWDVLINPAGLLFDISERVINPTSHPESLTTTVIFFMLIGVIYIFFWQLIGALRNPKNQK